MSIECTSAPTNPANYIEVRSLCGQKSKGVKLNLKISLNSSSQHSKTRSVDTALKELKKKQKDVTLFPEGRNT